MTEVDTQADRTRSPLVPLVMVAAIAVVLAYAEAVHGLLATLAFSGLAAILSRALQLWLHGRGMGRGLSVTLTVVAYVLVLGLLAAAAVASVLAIAVQLSGDAGRLSADLENVAGTFAAATGLPPGSVPSIDTGAVIAGVRQLLATVGPAVTSLGMSVLIVTYLLLDADNLRARMLRHTPAGTVARYDSLAAELVVYIRVRAVLGAAAAFADTILLLVIGVPYAVLWGVVSFLFSFVPNIGFLLALVPPTVFALLELGLGPAVLVVSILFWTVVIGPAGALLAVPLTIAMRVLLVPFENARWFVALLGPIPGDPPETVPADPAMAAVPDPVAPSSPS